MNSIISSYFILLVCWIFLFFGIPIKIGPRNNL